MRWFYPSVASWFSVALSCFLPNFSQSQTTQPRFLDLSLMVAPDYPCTWPTFPRFQLNREERIGTSSPYNSDILILDGNTGTQLDVPPHSVTPFDSGLANAGKFGKAYTDKIEAWQFGGEACVIDCRDLLDTTPNGRSDFVTAAKIKLWEKKNRPLGPGDVVLFYSGYGDKYYKPLPEGRRFLIDPLEKRSPGWPDPDPDCMEYLASKKVMTLGTDSPSMGPLPDLAEPVHFAGLKHGMIWTESAIGLGALPTTGAFYCMIGPKHAGGAYGEGRAFAVVGNPLAKRLIESARKKNAVDLSVTLAENWPITWPGSGVGNQRQAYSRILFGFNPNLKKPFEMYMMESQTGTHMVPPAYALPTKGFNNNQYSPEVRNWLQEYETLYGPRGFSDITTEKVPISQTCGPARVIDVTNRVSTLNKTNWPGSPEIRPFDIQEYEKTNGALKEGDIVLFRTGYSDRFFKPFPEGKAFMEDPLNGLSEGWPSLNPEAVLYLASKGIRCVGTDGPTLSGVETKRALWTNWAMAGSGMVGIEFLTNLKSLEKRNAYFLFAPVKVRDCHGGPGRAIALYD